MAWLYGLLCWFFGRLSLRWARRVGHALGWLAWVLRVRRATTISQLRASLVSEDSSGARQLARRVYGHLGCGAVEFLRTGQLTPDAARALLGKAALVRLAQVLARGKGALVLGAHLGNWDLLACAAARCGLPVSVVTRQLKQRSLNRFWMRQRRDCGVGLLPAGPGSALAVRGALRRNEVVAMVLDQHQPGGLVVPFFGRPAATSDALARVARATGAPVLPAFLLRTAGGFRLDLLDEVVVSRTANRQGDVLEATRRFTAVIEGQVRRYPEQWLWLHRRWKVNGIGDPGSAPAGQGADH